MAPHADIIIGTSGYSYDDWVGPFYPPGTPKSRYLEHYSTHFQTVEINYTYYQMPQVRNIEGVVSRTGGNLTFSIKAHQQYTHDLQNMPGLTAFTNSLEPMIDAGVLAGILFQFPYAFKYSRANQARLQAIGEGLDGLPGIIEFRHRSWLKDDVYCFLSDLGLSFCSLDQPELDGLPGLVSRVTADPGYLRFHGRNASRWWDHTYGWERYDYLYSMAELSEWGSIITGMRRNCRKLYVYFNNHYQGQAVKNAQMFAAFMAE